MTGPVDERVVPKPRAAVLVSRDSRTLQELTGRGSPVSSGINDPSVPT